MIELSRIEAEIRQIISGSGHAAAIVASFEDEHAVQFADSITTEPVLRTKSETAVCWMAKAKVVPQASEGPEEAQT